MTETKTANWYNKKRFLLPALVIIPPLGIYGAWKSKRKVLSKIALTFASPFLSLLFLIIILAIANPSTGKANSPNKEQNPAKEALIEVGEQEQINALYGLSNTEIETLKAFQKRWADSVVKVMNTGDGGFSLKGSKLALPDSILLEYSEGVTRNGFAANLKVDTVIYRQWYTEAVRNSLGENYLNYPVYITCIPNRNVNFAEVEAKEKALIERKNKIARQFSVWDGSHKNLERYIKQNMNDPRSYDHEQTTYEDKGEYILVQTKFRGKNAFGAKVIDIMTAKVDLEGNILSIVE